jgi:hypothetical protein
LAEKKTLFYSILVILAFIVIGGLYSFNVKPTDNNKNDTNSSIILNPLQGLYIEKNFGPSKVQYIKLTSENPNSNTTTIQSIDAGIIFNYTTLSKIKTSYITVELSVYFDGILRKTTQINVSAPSNQMQKILFLRINDTNIVSWSQNVNQPHTISFKIVPGGYLKVNFENGKNNTVAITPSENKFNVTVLDNKSDQVYLIEKENSKIVVRNSYGTELFSGSDIVNIITSLDRNMKVGDTIIISNGTYKINTPIKINSNGVTIKGQYSTKLQATQYLDSPILTTGSSSNNITISNLIFDANFQSITPVVLIAGNSHIVEKCTLTNATMYGLIVYKAHNFKFLNNTIITAQYGIATGGDYDEFCTNGLIANNNIKDSRDCGIKIRWCKNLLVINNTIDTSYLTWSTTPGPNIEHTPSGIRFYDADGPNVNVSVTKNTILNTKRTCLGGSSTAKVAGILGDGDSGAYWLSSTNVRGNQQIATENSISNCYYGILANWNSTELNNNIINCTYSGISIRGNSGLIQGNIIANSPIGIEIIGKNNRVSGNLITNCTTIISNKGSENIIN